MGARATRGGAKMGRCALALTVLAARCNARYNRGACGIALKGGYNLAVRHEEASQVSSQSQPITGQELGCKRFL
jgi:hypothetical protein